MEKSSPVVPGHAGARLRCARSFEEKERLRTEDNVAYAYSPATNLDWTAARAAALAWEDAGVQPEKYLYRCYVSGLVGQDTAIASGWPAMSTPQPALIGVRAEESDGAIVLYWSRPLNETNLQ